MMVVDHRRYENYSFTVLSSHSPLTRDVFFVVPVFEMVGKPLASTNPPTRVRCLSFAGPEGSRLTGRLDGPCEPTVLTKLSDGPSRPLHQTAAPDQRTRPPYLNSAPDQGNRSVHQVRTTRLGSWHRSIRTFSDWRSRLSEP